MSKAFVSHIEKMCGLLLQAEASDGNGNSLSIDDGVNHAIALVGEILAAGGKVMFIGNGGSAAIASHMAIDYLRNGGVPAITFNDAASLTCLGNDFGYEHVFSRQIELHAREQDLLIAISSSGASQNILNGVGIARERGCRVLSLSGFSPENPLRSGGDLNFYVASHHYGRVEASHLLILHAFLDLSGGWGG